MALIKSDIRTFVTDKGMKKFLKELEFVKGGSHVKVGIQSDAEAPASETGGTSSDTPPSNPLTMAQLASVHEFGSMDRITPERSFIRSTMDERRKVFEVVTDTVLNQIMLGKMNAKAALEIVGAAIEKSIKKKITVGPFQELSQATIDARARRSVGSSRPLVDTGRLRASIRFKVVRRKKTIKKGITNGEITPQSRVFEQEQ